MHLEPLIAAYATRFHGPGQEEGPDALAAALGIAAARRVTDDCEAPIVDALAALRATLDETAGVPLVLCGECTLAPAVAGFVRDRHPSAALVWVDAHGDLNTPATSPSGFAGGMPFAALLGWCRPEWRAASGLHAPFPLDRAVLVGARDLDPGEREAIDRAGLREAGAITRGAALLGPGAVWLHLDMDVLDPGVTGTADFPAPDGWTTDRFARDLADALAANDVIAISICAGNPRRDADGAGFRAIATALAPLLA